MTIPFPEACLADFARAAEGCRDSIVFLKKQINGRQNFRITELSRQPLAIIATPSAPATQARRGRFPRGWDAAETSQLRRPRARDTVRPRPAAPEPLHVLPS